MKTAQEIVQQFDESFPFVSERATRKYKSFIKHAMREAADAMMVDDKNILPQAFLLLDKLPKNMDAQVGRIDGWRAARQAQLTKRAAFFGNSV